MIMKYDKSSLWHLLMKKSCATDQLIKFNFRIDIREFKSVRATIEDTVLLLFSLSWLVIISLIIMKNCFRNNNDID